MPGDIKQSGDGIQIGNFKEYCMLYADRVTSVSDFLDHWQPSTMGTPGAPFTNMV